MARVHHMVLLAFTPGTPERTAADFFADLGRLKALLPGMVYFAGGPYCSPEGLNQGFTHGFLMTFHDAQARDEYLFHPEHEAVKARHLPAVEKVIAFDFEER